MAFSALPGASDCWYGLGQDGGAETVHMKSKLHIAFTLSGRRMQGRKAMTSVSVVLNMLCEYRRPMVLEYLQQLEIIGF